MSIYLSSREYGDLTYTRTSTDPLYQVISFSTSTINPSNKPLVTFRNKDGDIVYCPIPGETYFLYDVIEKKYLEWLYPTNPTIENPELYYSCVTCSCNPSLSPSYQKEKFFFCPGFPCFILQEGRPKTTWTIRSYQSGVITVTLTNDYLQIPITLFNSTGNIICNCGGRCSTENCISETNTCTETASMLTTNSITSLSGGSGDSPSLLFLFIIFLGVLLLFLVTGIVIIKKNKNVSKDIKEKNKI